MAERLAFEPVFRIAGHTRQGTYRYLCAQLENAGEWMPEVAHTASVLGEGCIIVVPGAGFTPAAVVAIEHTGARPQHQLFGRCRYNGDYYHDGGLLNLINAWGAWTTLLSYLNTIEHVYVTSDYPSLGDLVANCVELFPEDPLTPYIIQQFIWRFDDHAWRQDAVDQLQRLLPPPSPLPPPPEAADSLRRGERRVTIGDNRDRTGQQEAGPTSPFLLHPGATDMSRED